MLSELDLVLGDLRQSQIFGYDVVNDDGQNADVDDEEHDAPNPKSCDKCWVPIEFQLESLLEPASLRWSAKIISRMIGGHT